MKEQGQMPLEGDVRDTSPVGGGVSVSLIAAAKLRHYRVSDAS